ACHRPESPPTPTCPTGQHPKELPQYMPSPLAPQLLPVQTIDNPVRRPRALQREPGLAEKLGKQTGNDRRPVLSLSPPAGSRQERLPMPPTPVRCERGRR